MSETLEEKLRGILDECGGLKNILREMALFERDVWRLDSIAQDLTKEYPNYWAAMLNEELLGVWKTHGALMRFLRRIQRLSQRKCSRGFAEFDLQRIAYSESVLYN